MKKEGGNVLKISIDERKDFISKVATKVFSEKGYQSASLQDIAKGLNISKAGIYYYFKSKDDLLAYILIRNSDIFLAKLQNTIKKNKEEGLDPQESFKRLIHTYAQHVNIDKDKRLIVLRERHQLTDMYKRELLKRERQLFHILKGELKKITNLKEEIDPNVITFMLISMSHWLGYWFKEGKKLDLETIIDQNIWIIFNGIMKPGKKRPSDNLIKMRPEQFRKG